MTHYQHAFSVLLCLFIFNIASGQRDFNIELLSSISHGNILTNDVWGYTDQNGKEYGVVGTRAEAIIYDLSDPSHPQVVHRVPGAFSIWRDFKSFGNFIYQTTDQGQDGLTIIDMTQAPDTITSFLYQPMLELGGRTTALRTCHNIWIDDRGYAYLSGCNISAQGVLIFDIASDPYDPAFIGAADERYAHDAITQDTFLYASEINQGNLAIYSISDPTRPRLISRTQTSSSFTHNAWMSDDGKYIFTTDERTRAFVDAYDITDPENPQRIDTYQPSPGKQVIPHNAHYHNGFLVVSWYSEGVIILDAHRPDNLVRVGQYDTHPQSDEGGDGCWGAYPYFASEIITVGDINRGFFVLRPHYQRAAYLEGQVFEAGTFAPVNNAHLLILDTDKTSTNSNASGDFKTGTIDTGSISVVITHPDYIQDTFKVTFNSGVVTKKSFLLRRKSPRTITGTLSNEAGDPVPQATVQVVLNEGIFEVHTNADGFYELTTFEGPAQLLAAAWGYKMYSDSITISQDLSRDITLASGHEDHFFADLGWQVTGDATSGIWVRDIPVPTLFDFTFANPNMDLPDDIGQFCYITGNSSVEATEDDVDNGSTILTSPIIQLQDYQNPAILLHTWLYNGGGSNPLNDTMHIDLVSEGVSARVRSIIYSPEGGANVWSAPVEIKIQEFFPDAISVQIQITVSDLPPNGHIVEGGIDGFSIKDLDTTTSTEDDPEILSFAVMPNPVTDWLYLSLDPLQHSGKIQIIGINGMEWRMNIDQGVINVSHLPQGVYQIKVWSNNKIYHSRFVKI